jgi:hypothetical protein
VHEAFPIESATREGVVGQLSAFLANISLAWEAPALKAGNRVARQLFSEAIIENRTVVVVKPRPELPPFVQGSK